MAAGELRFTAPPAPGLYWAYFTEPRVLDRKTPAPGNWSRLERGPTSEVWTTHCISRTPNSKKYILYSTEFQKIWSICTQKSGFLFGTQSISWILYLYYVPGLRTLRLNQDRVFLDGVHLPQSKDKIYLFQAKRSAL